MDKPPDPPPPPNAPVYCSTSKAAPTLDLVIAVPHALLALLGLVILTESDNDGDEVGEAIGDVFGTALLIEGGAVALLYGLSARSGFKYADKLGTPDGIKKLLLRAGQDGVALATLAPSIGSIAPRAIATLFGLPLSGMRLKTLSVLTSTTSSVVRPSSVT